MIHPRHIPSTLLVSVTLLIAPASRAAPIRLGLARPT